MRDLSQFLKTGQILAILSKSGTWPSRKDLLIIFDNIFAVKCMDSFIISLVLSS